MTSASCVLSVKLTWSPRDPSGICVTTTWRRLLSVTPNAAARTSVALCTVRGFAQLVCTQGPRRLKNRSVGSTISQLSPL